MLLRALVFYLAIFPVCADTEVIEYLIPEEVMGVYQSPYAFRIETGREKREDSKDLGS